MSGYTKHMCENDVQDAKKSINNYLKSVIPLLPCTYDFELIKNLLYKYYPYEMFLIDEKHKYYFRKEKSLISKGKKSRYTFPVSDIIISYSQTYKKIFSDEYKRLHQQNFDEHRHIKSVESFSAIRDPKIKKIFEKIEKAKLKTQQVEPEFLDALMGLYDRKNTSQKDKVYIIKELQKYYCNKVINFFSKKVDTEYNRQLREISFYHLQSLGFQPVLRKQKYMIIPSKNKKRREFLKNIYAKERYNVNEIPEELEYRIQNSKEQKIKTYDFFISHSSMDYNEVQFLISHLNQNRKNIYCDWINDNDYLKRNLVGNSTLNVLIKRLQQSKEMIFVISENSMKSNWCKYELNDFYLQKKCMYFVKKEDLKKGIVKLEKYDDKWYFDPLYKQMDLFGEKKQEE